MFNSSPINSSEPVQYSEPTTSYFLDVARKTGFMEVVDDLVRNKGVLYGGTSPYSIIASPTIEAAGWGGDGVDRDEVGLTDLTSFEFLTFVTYVHYDPVNEKEMILTQKRDTLIYAIPDGGAVEVNGGSVTNYGNVEIL